MRWCKDPNNSVYIPACIKLKVGMMDGEVSSEEEEEEAGKLLKLVQWRQALCHCTDSYAALAVNRLVPDARMHRLANREKTREEAAAAGAPRRHVPGRAAAARGRQLTAAMARDDAHREDGELTGGGRKRVETRIRWQDDGADQEREETPEIDRKRRTNMARNTAVMRALDLS